MKLNLSLNIYIKILLQGLSLIKNNYKNFFIKN